MLNSTDVKSEPYLKSPMLSFCPGRKDIENINIGLSERISTLKICQEIIKKKLKIFMEDSEIPTETLLSLYKESENKLKSKQDKFEQLIGKNLFEYTYEKKKVLLSEYKYKIVIRDDLGFNEYFSQQMVKNIKRSSEDLVGTLKNLAILNENFGLLIEGHVNDVTCLAISNDGKLIATGSGDSSVKIWNYSNLKIVNDLRRHKNLVSCILFMKTKFKLISGSWDSRIIMWNLKKNTEKVIQSGFSEITSIDLTNDDLFLAYASWNFKVNVINLKNKSSYHTFSYSMNIVKSIKFNKTGKFLICGSRDHSIYIQNIELKKLHLNLRYHDYYISCISISEDDKFIVSGSSDKQVILYVFDESCSHQVLWRHEADVNCVEISKNNSFVVSAGYDNKIVIFNIIKNTVSRIIDTAEYKTRSIKLNLSNNELIAVGEKISICKYFSSNHSNHQESFQHTSKVKCLKFVNSKRVALSYAVDGIKVWDLVEANILNSIDIQGYGYNSMSILKSEKYFVLSKGNTSFIMKMKTIIGRDYTYS